MAHKLYHIHIDRSVKQYAPIYNHFVQFQYRLCACSVQLAFSIEKINRKNNGNIHVSFSKTNYLPKKTPAIMRRQAFDQAAFMCEGIDCPCLFTS
jgi:hypothetical protein